ncbi:MAG TPA: alkaline phosphatase family protein, partial [Thermoplasmata archaeon]|nr:alkaline phosphatase family protein [Thermoplasmata archaeon]
PVYEHRFDEDRPRPPLERPLTTRRWLTRLLYVGLVGNVLVLAGMFLTIFPFSPRNPFVPVTTPGGPSGPGGAAPLNIQHVVVIVLENREVGDVWALAPYERYLQANYGNATSFYGLCHGSPPNYLALTSGRPSFCGDNVSGPVNTSNLPDSVEGAGLSWAGYFESMPSACYAYSYGPYLVWHNPFVSYDDIIDKPSRCAAHVLPSARFNASVANGTLPTVSFYVPNAFDDCDNSSLTNCDHWLQAFLSPVLNSSNAATVALVAHTAFFIVYDEGVTNAGFAGPVVTADCLEKTGKALTTCGGRIYMAVVSPFSLGTRYVSDATMYNVESTIEWLFGIPGDGGYDSSSDFPPMTSLFTFTSNTQ